MGFKYVSQLSAYPGEQFQLGVQAFDELGRPTATILRLSETDVSVVCEKGRRSERIGSRCMYITADCMCIASFCPTTVVSLKIKMKAKLFVVHLQSASSQGHYNCV